MPTSPRTACVVLLLVQIWFSFEVSSGQSVKGNAQAPEQIALHEAEILVYLTPAAVETRLKGMDVGWEQSTDAKLNVNDYYFFWVYNATRTKEGSVTIGHYAVNKHTADMWNFMSGQRLDSKELEKVQSILRRAHRISDTLVARYRSPEFWAVKKQ